MYSLVISKPQNKIQAILRTNQVITFQNFVFMNEDLLKDNLSNYYPTISSFLEYNQIARVTLTEKHFIAHLSNNRTIQPIAYIVERFKSFGNKNTHEMAELISQVYELINEVKHKNVHY